MKIHMRRVLDEEEWRRWRTLTESLVRTKLSTSIERVAPSFCLSSAFLARAMVMIGMVVVVKLGLMIWGASSLKKPKR